MIKNKFFFIIICFIHTLNSFFEINWQNTTVSNETESNLVYIDCSYKTDEYILSDDFKIIIYPGQENAATSFKESFNHIYSPLYPGPLLILPQQGEFSIVVSDPKLPLEKITIFYKTYNLEEKTINPLTSISVSPYIFEDTESNDLKIHEDENLQTISNAFFENEIIENQEEYDNNLIEENNISETSKQQSDKKETNRTISNFFINLLQSSDNPFLLFIIIYLLGILMSLTPCIYPMIPITISILQENAQRESLKLHSLFYVMGIGIVFSILGLFAVSGFMTFGALLGKSWFVIVICLSLSYLAGSMFGFYEFYIPQLNFGFLKGGNLFSSFLLGALSGTITSPCVSPGLLTLLTVVGQNGNYITGFIMLFIFGLGIGTPLFIASSLFHSAHQMPKAGKWMIDIKKIIGAFILLVIHSYIKTFIPEIISTILFYIFFGILIHMILKTILSFINFDLDAPSKKNKHIVLYIKILILIGYIAIPGYYIYKYYAYHNIYDHHSFMMNNFEEARELALQNEKYLLLDFTAEWCSACKTIEKKVLGKSIFWESLSESIIGVSIDCSESSSKYIKDILSRYNIKGFPTILLINPYTNEIIANYNTWIHEDLEQIIQTVQGDINNVSK
jgi:thiol:disulfide interchange protein DsbD